MMFIRPLNGLVLSRSLHGPRVDPPANPPVACRLPPALRQHVERKRRTKMHGGKLELKGAHFIFMCSKGTTTLAAGAAGGNCEPLFCFESARKCFPRKSLAARHASGGAYAGASERLWVWVQARSVGRRSGTCIFIARLGVHEQQRKEPAVQAAEPA